MGISLVVVEDELAGVVGVGVGVVFSIIALISYFSST